MDVVLGYNICSDQKDVPYVALAIALNAPLLTGDKRLIESVKGSVNVLSLRQAQELV